MLACELARHGAALRIIDRLPAIRQTARATGVHSRTLEIFQNLGVVREIIEQAAFIRGANQFAGGQLITHLRSDGLDSPFPFSASLEQWRVEQALVQKLQTLGVAIERETELLDLQQEGDRVRATLRRADGTSEVVTTPWLVGCDGAHSRVRHLCGEAFPGEVDPRQYLVADVVLDGMHAPDEIFVYLTSQGVLWWFPLPEGRSLLAGDVQQQYEEAREPPQLKDVQAMLDHRAPPGLRAHDPRWLSWFHIHYRLAPHYRHGRCFLAGDAAHIHSPIGGQGMNTGIQDAYNLGWKLALVARGEAPESLLDSYEAERKAVAADVLATTRGLTEKAEAYVTLEPADRERLFRYLVLPEADRMKMLGHNEELDLDYRRSPLCCEGLEHPSAATSNTDELHAGAEARDAGPLVVNGERLRLFELLRGGHHSLLLVPGSSVQAIDVHGLAISFARECGEWLRLYLVTAENRPPLPDSAVICVEDVDGSLCRRYGGAEARMYLVRPDGYIGFRGRAEQWPELRSHLASYLNLEDSDGRQNA